MSEPVTQTPAEVTNQAAAPAAPVTPPASQPAPAAAAVPSPKAEEKAPAQAEVVPPKPEQKVEEKAPEVKPPVVPEKYDLKLPEGSLLHASHVEKIATDAKALGLSQEQAQAQLNRESQLKADFQADLLQQHNAQADAWAAAAKADPEIGGVNHNRVVELSKRFISDHASPAFKKMLDDSRYGDHPEMLRMIWRATKNTDEDQMVNPGAQTRPVERSTKDVLYGDTVAKE